MLPNDFPPWKSVSDYFRPWKKSGLWPRINEKLGQEVGDAGARHKEARAGMVDSQAVKTTEQGGQMGATKSSRYGHWITIDLGRWRVWG